MLSIQRLGPSEAFDRFAYRNFGTIGAIKGFTFYKWLFNTVGTSNSVHLACQEVVQA